MFFTDAEICIAIGMIPSYEFCDKKKGKRKKELLDTLYMNSRYNIFMIYANGFYKNLK